MVNPIPEGFNTVNAHLVVSPAADAIEFYKKAFGAEEIVRMTMPDSKSVMHAELKIGDSTIMIAEEYPDHGMVGPGKLGGSPVVLNLYVTDADAMFERAVEAGATPTMPVEEMFWGDRYGKLKDPFGHNWSVSTHVKDLTPEEIAKAAAEMFSQGDCGGE